MSSRPTANAVAAAVFFTVLLLGAWVLGGSHHVDEPRTTTTVTRAAVVAGATKPQRTVEVVSDGRGRRQKKTTTTVTASAPETETTTVEGVKSFAERVLGDSGVVFLQAGVLLLAAFVAAGAIQRALVGQYGGFKVGSLAVEELASASTAGVDDLRAALATLQQGLAGRQGELEVELQSVRAQLEVLERDAGKADAKLNKKLSAVATRVATLDQWYKETHDD